MTEKKRRRHAVAGRCSRCEKRIVRGFADDGSLVNVDIFGTTDATEQLERSRGRGTFVLAWRGMGMTITRRTDDDVLLRPAGFRLGERVVLEHACETTGAKA